MRDQPSFLIRPVLRDGPEWHRLIRTQEAAQIGLYSRKEARAMNTGHFVCSWLPQGHCALVEALGAEVDGELIGWIHVWGRDDDTAVLESLFVHPPYRSKRYARRLIREAIEVAKRGGYAMVEVHAMEREPNAISVWQHLLGTPPNNPGHVNLLGHRWQARGWRLPAASLSV